MPLAVAVMAMLGCAFVTLGPEASPAGANGGSIGNLSVSAAPEATGLQHATYTINFTATSGLGAGSPAITVQAPEGTDFSNANATWVDHTDPNDDNPGPENWINNAPNVYYIGGGGFIVNPGDSLTVTITNVTNPPTANNNAVIQVSTDNDPNPVPATYRIAPEGYWLVGSDGGIFSFGSAQFYGSTGSLVLQRPVVGIVATADHGGYWLDASDGGVFSYGDTAFYGSIPGLGLHPAGSGLPHSLVAPIVGMVPSADDRGYFMVASDGGVFAFGDATFAGSCYSVGGCSGAAVSVMPDATGGGYWLVTSLGAVYAFGDAHFLGAPGNTGAPVTAAVRTPDGNGYWILDAAGNVHGYGDAANLGNVSTSGAFDGITSALWTDSPGDGYGTSALDGAVKTFGGVPNYGGMENTNLNGSIIAASGF